jgi:predicted Rossmann fold nucleotide-binding protein DprA/Smf involved in DNA uptake
MVERKFVGIIGNGKDKFTALGKQRALEVIRGLIGPNVVVVSGHSPVGGIDIWAEDEAKKQGVEMMIFAPAKQKWDGGYKQRNMEIAKKSSELHVIVVEAYPEDYVGRRDFQCYHCFDNRPRHVRSGACWVARIFTEMHPERHVVYHIVSNT